MQQTKDFTAESLLFGFWWVFLGKVRNVDAVQFNLDVKQSASLQK